MVSGKCGVLYCHMGAGGAGLQPLKEALALGEVPITQILPTHVSRTADLVSEGAEWIRNGGWVDLTADDRVRNDHLFCLAA